MSKKEFSTKDEDTSRTWKVNKQANIITKLNHKLMNPSEMFKISQGRKLTNKCTQYKLPNVLIQYKDYKNNLQ
jgi:hypothetical protein